MHENQLKQRTIGHVLADKARRVGDRTWLIYGRDRYTYARAHDLSNRYANGFRALGIGKGDHVAVMLPNCPEFIWTIWGLAKLGAVVVPLNTAARGELLRYFITQSDSISAIVAAEWAARMAEALGGEHKVGSFLTLGGGEADLAALGRPVGDLAAFANASPKELDRDAVLASDPQYIMYTSGTTGPSKGVISPHSQAHGVGRSLAQNFGYRPDDVLYTCLPLFHGNALWYSAYAALWADAALAVSPRFSASGFWDEIRASGATQFNSLGAMTNILLRAPASPRDREHRVRQAMIVPLSPQTYREVSDRFGVQVTSLYAMTETFAVTMFTPDDPESKGASAARPGRAADRERRGRSAADARGRRDLRAAVRARHRHGGLLQDARGHGARYARPLAAHGRSRLAGRGRLPLFRRPQEGGHPPPRREHLRLRGRDADRAAPLRARGRGRAGCFGTQRGRG